MSRSIAQRKLHFDVRHELAGVRLSGHVCQRLSLYVNSRSVEAQASVPQAARLLTRQPSQARCSELAPRHARQSFRTQQTRGSSRAPGPLPHLPAWSKQLSIGAASPEPKMRPSGPPDPKPRPPTTSALALAVPAENDTAPMETAPAPPDTSLRQIRLQVLAKTNERRGERRIEAGRERRREKMRNKTRQTKH